MRMTVCAVVCTCSVLRGTSVCLSGSESGGREKKNREVEGHSAWIKLQFRGTYGGLYTNCRAF